MHAMSESRVLPVAHWLLVAAPRHNPLPPLTLIKTEYWDRAGGGGNISHDW